MVVALFNVSTINVFGSFRDTPSGTGGGRRVMLSIWIKLGESSRAWHQGTEKSEKISPDMACPGAVGAFWRKLGADVSNCTGPYLLSLERVLCDDQTAWEECASEKPIRPSNVSQFIAALVRVTW